MFCVFTARFMSELAGNPEDRFSHNEAHFAVQLNVLGSELLKNQGRFRKPETHL